MSYSQYLRVPPDVTNQIDPSTSKHLHVLLFLLLVLAHHISLVPVAGTCDISCVSPALQPIFTSHQGNWVLPKEANPET